MKKVLKWLGILVGGLVGLVIIALGVVYLMTGMQMNRTYDVAVTEISVPTDEASVSEGRRLFITRGCADCHLRDGEGSALVDGDPVFGTLYASNLTTGQGGTGSEYETDGQLARAIRHGIDAGNQPLLFMPSHEYYLMGDEDVSLIIAYIRSLDPVDTDYPKNSIGPLPRVLTVAGQFTLTAASRIDHDAARPAPPAVAATVEYGEYLGIMCTGCHGEVYSGGPIPGAPPEFAPAANITPAAIGDWSESDFITAMTTGKRPDGSDIDPTMPWKNFSLMTETELQALWAYLQTIPPQEYGNR